MTGDVGPGGARGRGHERGVERAGRQAEQDGDDGVRFIIQLLATTMSNWKLSQAILLQESLALKLRTSSRHQKKKRLCQKLTLVALD